MQNASPSRKGQWFYYVGSMVPSMLLLIIVVTIYSIYMGTYLYPLITGSYNEHPVPQTSLAELPYFIQLVALNDRMFAGLQTSSHTGSRTSCKGLVIACIIHPLLALFFVTMFRVVRRDPGRVPKVPHSMVRYKSWLDQINEEIHQYIQNENAILNECKQQRRELQSSHHSTECETARPHEASRIESSVVSELDEELRAELNLRAKLELIDKQGRRFCKNCTAFKPERAHHCRQCKTCWLKMDHHCQWLNNCIGLHNYKLFVNLILYGQLLLLLMTFTYLRCYYDSMQRVYLSDIELFLIAFNFYFMFMLLFLMTGFVMFHLWIISINRTTLEYCERKRLHNEETSSCAYQNFIKVFGTNPAVWFLPIRITPTIIPQSQQSKGMHFVDRCSDSLKFVNTMEDPQRRESNSQEKQRRRRRTRKDSGVAREYECPCGKNYLSYPALYTHIKQKHAGVVLSFPPTKQKPPGEITKPQHHHSQTNSGELSDTPISEEVSFSAQEVAEAIKLPHSMEKRRLTYTEIKILLVQEVCEEFMTGRSSAYRELLLQQYTSDPLSIDALPLDQNLHSCNINTALVLFINDVEAALDGPQMQVLFYFSFFYRRAASELFSTGCEGTLTRDIADMSNFFVVVLLPQYISQLQLTMRQTGMQCQLLYLPNLKEIMTQLTLLFNNWLYARQLTNHQLKLRNT